MNSDDYDICPICGRSLYKDENPYYCIICLENFENRELNLLLDEDFIPLRWIRVGGAISDKYLIALPDNCVSKYSPKSTMRI